MNQYSKNGRNKKINYRKHKDRREKNKNQDDK